MWAARPSAAAPGSALLVLVYFIEGVVRAWADSGLSRTLALAEVVLAVVYFWSVLLWLRLGRTQRPATAP